MILCFFTWQFYFAYYAFLLYLCAHSEDLSFSRTQTIPLASNKTVLSAFEMSTCAWWSPRIIYSSHRDTRIVPTRRKQMSFFRSPFFCFFFPFLFFFFSFCLIVWRGERCILFCFFRCAERFTVELQNLNAPLYLQVNISRRISLMEYRGRDVISYLHAKINVSELRRPERS